MSTRRKRTWRDFIVGRMREPSTWVGVAVVLSQGAQAWATRDPHAIAAALAGVVGIVAPERGAGA